MSAQQEVIKKFMASLDNTTKKGTAALDEAVQACSNFNTIQEVMNKMINDCENASSADDFLKNYCGINLNNTDTGAITGKDAGGSKLKTAVSIVPESGSIKNFTSDSFKVNGLTLKLDTSYSNLTEDQKFIWQGLYTWWAKSALDLIADSYGYSFNDNDATVKTITVKFLYEESGLRANTYGEFPNGITMNLIDFGINNYLYCNFDLSNVNGKSTNDSLYLDRTIAHELTHGIMAAKINYYGALPMLIREGIAELTHGSDDDSKNDLKTLAGNSDLLRQSLVLSTKYNEVAGVGSPDYSAGYMFFRYLAKQASINNSNIISGTNGADNLSNSLSGATINALSGNDEVYNYGSKSVVNLGAGNDTIGNYGNNTTINADSGKDFIGNAAAYSSINGGADNDTIFSSASNVTIVGGKGNDSIYFNSNSKNNLIKYENGDGNDTIFGYVSSDTISIGSSSSYSTMKSGSDMKINVGSGSILVKDSASTAVKIVGGKKSDSNSKLITGTNGADNLSNSLSGATINALSGNDEVYNYGSKSVVNLGAGNDTIGNYGNNSTINADSGKDYIGNAAAYSSLNGGADNDTIFSSASNVTIVGGKGNDSIYFNSNSKNNLIKYENGDGNDSIFGYVSTDTISIGSSSSYSTTKSGSDMKINVGSGSILVKDSASTAVKIVGGKKSDSNSKLITGTNGADNLSNSLSGATINALSGNDEVYNYGSKSVVNLGAGNDTIGNYGNNTTINADSGKDFIGNAAAYSSINGGADNDTIFSSASNVTIVGGKGNDSIYFNSNSKNNLIKYENGDGNDSIFGYVSSDTISIGSSSSYSTTKSGSDMKINVGSGSILVKDSASTAVKIVGGKTTSSNSKIINGTEKADTLKSSSSNVTIYAGSGNDSIRLYTGANNNKIDAGAGNDTIDGGGSKTYINAGAGNDYVKLYSDDTKITINSEAGNDTINGVGTNSYIDAGSGNDSIRVYGNNSNTIILAGAGNDTINGGGSKALINAGAGNDYIKLYNSDKNITVTGGTGNDTIYSSSLGTVFQYADGDGDDVIINYSSKDTIKTHSKITYYQNTVGNDILVTIGGGVLRLKDAKGQSLNVVGGYGSVYENYSERWFMDNEECRMQNDELETIIENKNDLIVDDFNFNDQINSQEKITSLTYNQTKKK